MARLPIRPNLALIMFAPAILASIAFAQSRETLETRVTGVGDHVTLSWSKKHPWDTDLARGAFLQIEYHGPNGVGVDCLNTAATSSARTRTVGCLGIPGSRVSGQDRTLTFQLPAALTSAPQGPVCLMIRLPDQRVLPIRQASKQGDNTSRFQMQDWGRQVSDQANRTKIEREIAQAGASVAEQTRNIAEQQRLNATRGWTSPAACEAQTGGSLTVERDRPIAEPQQQDEIARTVCVMRLSTAEKLMEDDAKDLVKGGKFKTLPEAQMMLSLYYPAYRRVQPPSVLTGLLALVDPERRKQWAAVRGQQITQFVEDWERLAPRVPEYRRMYSTPHFESYAATLNTQSLAQEAAKRIRDAIAKGDAPEPKDIFGFIGTALESYDRCISDGKVQLSLNYQQSTDLKTTKTNLEARLKEQAVKACREGVSKVERMQVRLTELKAAQTQIEQRLTQFSVVPLSNRSQDLNSTACTP